MNILVHAMVAIHALAAGAYLWLQPTGFAVGSRPFIEHQLLVPATFALGAAAVATFRRRNLAWRIAAGAIAGQWIAVGAVVAIVGTTPFARLMAIPAALAVAALVRAREVRWPALPGAALGAAFLWATWAPPATTRPSGGPDVGATHPGGVRLRRLEIDAGFHFRSASRSGLWTILDYHEERTFPRVEERASEVIATTEVDHDVCAHLASALRIRGQGAVRVNGVPWRSWDGTGSPEFLAFRGGRLELLRASEREKGPFTTLASWEPHDPLVEIGEVRFRVVGWADQASRAESPTAGWGVSQGVVEHVGGTLVWSLATTGIGRGWHAVRTARGRYRFSVRVE